MEVILLKKTYNSISSQPTIIRSFFYFKVKNEIQKIKITDFFFNYFNEGEKINVIEITTKHNDEVVSVEYNLNEDEKFNLIIDVLDNNINDYKFLFNNKDILVTNNHKNKFYENLYFYSFSYKDSKEELFCVEQGELYNFNFELDKENKIIYMSIKENSLLNIV